MTGQAPVREGHALRTMGYGALAGAIGGMGLSLALFVVWAAYALGPGGSLEGAFAVTALLSGIVSFPALLFASTDTGTGGGPLSLAQAFVIGLPLATWLVVGTLSGAVVDVLRAVRR